MSVNNQITKNVWTCDGSTRTFSYGFDIATLDGSDIAVYVTDNNKGISKILSGYNIDLANKTVTYPIAPVAFLPAGYKVTLMRSEEFTQLVDLLEGGAFSAEVIELALDKLTMLCQQLQEQLDRSVQLPIDQTGGGSYLLTEIVNSVADAQTAASSAQASASAAVIAAESLNIEAPSVAKAGKVLVVRADGTGYSVGATLPSISASDVGKALLVNPAGDGYVVGVSASNPPVMLMHIVANPAMNIAQTSYDLLASGKFYSEASRLTITKFSVGLVEKGNGNAKIEITDGSSTVTATLPNNNRGSYTGTSFLLDCTGLADNTVWTVNIYGQAVSGDYEIQRFILQAPQINLLADSTLITQSPNYRTNQADLVRFDTKKFPVNYAIDTACKVKLLAKVTLENATSAVLKGVLTTVSGSDTSTTQVSLNVGASGVVSGMIDFPTVIAPTVQLDLYFSTAGGFARVEHYEARLVI